MANQGTISSTNAAAAFAVKENSHKTSNPANMLNCSNAGGEVLQMTKGKHPKLGVKCKSVFKSGIANREEFNRLWAEIINLKENYAACVQQGPIMCYNGDMQSHAHRKDEVSGE